MATSLDFRISETIQRFVLSTADVCALIGPFGEGKSWGVVIKALYHAAKHGVPCRMCVIRDTLENIKISVKLTMKEALGNRVRFFDGDRQFEIKSNPKIEGFCLGIDDAAAMSRLQGMVGVSIFWLEEPAPIIYKENAGLAEPVFNFSLSRSTRGNIPPLVMVSMNPADEEHWTFKRLIEAPDFDSRFPLVRKEVFTIPKGENSFLGEKQRQVNAAALAGDPELYQRYVEGEFSFLQPGIAVAQAFKESTHVSKEPLEVLPGLRGFRFYDAWHHPCILLGQIYPNGRLFFTDTLYGDGIGMKQLIESSCLPLLESPKWRDKVSNWRDIGDRSMLVPDQSNTSITTASVVENLLGCRFEPGPDKWNLRKEAVQHALTYAPDGLPAVYI